jgi:hypothetical protein
MSTTAGCSYCRALSYQVTLAHRAGFQRLGLVYTSPYALQTARPATFGRPFENREWFVTPPVGRLWLLVHIVGLQLGRSSRDAPTQHQPFRLDRAGVVDAPAVRTSRHTRRPMLCRPVKPRENVPFSRHLHSRSYSSRSGSASSLTWRCFFRSWRMGCWRM